ncbi:hypothetical protein [Pelagibacterium sp. H642]|uniref:hypothetical protein n=1 Tax=Pelagibacterium sp. H642 TaxID=1881069 RepID=UPI002814E1F9|nr:hypothetical protein [Pelagibacterium sp. H642]WMT89119.1 hypothetical protein NO934_09795 [Pelagibacterium sp. H642]
MGLHKLARELEETARQTAEMVDGITASLLVLGDTSIDCTTARSTAIRQIVVALQMQDRIEQRCRNMAEAARRMAELPEGSDAQANETVWSSLTLDELRDESLSGIAARTNSGEVEFF